MKKVLYSVLAVAAMLLTASFSANAQEANEDLLIGPAGNNWFIGVGGGVNAMYDQAQFSTPKNLAINVNLGKWFTPAIGFRAGYLGMKDQNVFKTNWFAGDNQFGYNVAHLDALWNIANTVNYKESRVWNPILYVRGGYIFTKYNNEHPQGIGGGLGLDNRFRLGNRVSLSLDVSALVSNGKNFGAASSRFTTFLTGTAGLVFDLGGRGFKRPVAPKPDTKAIDDLRDQLRAANGKAADADRKAAALANQLAAFEGLVDGKTYDYNRGRFTEAKPATDVMMVPEILYFDLGKATLTGRELARLEYYAENTFKKDQKLLVTGCADLGTGTREANDRLSKQRAEYVKNVLVNQFGYKAENIETKADVMPGDAPIKGRIVTIEVK